MRSLISKVLTGSLIASAALAVSACGPKTETTTDNTMVTDMNTTEGMDTMTDNMTAVDGATNGARFRSYVADSLVPMLQPGDTVILLDVRSTSVLYGTDWGSSTPPPPAALPATPSPSPPPPAAVQGRWRRSMWTACRR